MIVNNKITLVERRIRKYQAPAYAIFNWILCGVENAAVCKLRRCVAVQSAE